MIVKDTPDVDSPFKPVFLNGRLDVADELRENTPFDVWAKRWKPEDDTFEWKRFTNCTWAWGSNRRPALYTENDVPLEETGYRGVYWIEIPKPGDVE